MRQRIVSILILIFISHILLAKTTRFRLSWASDPARTMIVGWDQVSGSNPVLYYSLIDLGQEFEKYPYQATPTKQIQSKGMNNTFVELRNLTPNTVYYFLVKDSEGTSKKFSFKTCSARNDKLSIIAGGDSRNHREVRQNANTLVSKLRADFVLFSGDMTNGDTDTEWIEWLNDWQLTIATDGRITPIVVARGNHEKSNETLVNLFMVPSPNCVYGLSFGENLVRVLSLNSLIAPGGDQKLWLTKDLESHQHFNWRIAQYHFPMRPHNSRKPENTEQADLWCPLFEKYKVQLGVESDAHLAKITYPIIRDPSGTAYEGFKRDDKKGTTYIGEGGWGAPLRANNDEKVWTIKSGSFNQFKWLIVEPQSMKIRTVIIQDYGSVTALNDDNRFSTPAGLKFWIINGLEEYVLKNHHMPSSQQEDPEPESEEIPFELLSFDYQQNDNNEVVVEWNSVADQLDEAYILERSIGGKPFERITRVKALGKAAQNHYKYVDKEPFFGNVKYRLVKVNLARRTQNELRLIDFVKKRPALKALREKIVLNSYDTKVDINFELPYEGKVMLLLIRSDYSVIAKQPKPHLPKGPHTATFNISTLSSGKYSVIIKLGGEILKKIDLIKLS